MLKIGVFGAGHLGSIHMKQWKEVTGVELVGFYDANTNKAEQVASELNIPSFSNADELLNLVDAVDVVTTTTSHFEVAQKAVLAGKHLFIEKPLTHTLEEGSTLVNMIKESGLKCQVGHVERYNPAFLSVSQYSLAPMFIESHRLAQFNPRGTDVSVILDLMIHDIDIILLLVKSSIRRISASGVAIMSESPDIANARIEFDNGCVANLTSSRISMKRMRKMRLFQRDAYVGIDFLEKRSEIIRLKGEHEAKGMLDIPIDLANGTQKIITMDLPQVQETNAIRMELQEFADAIRFDRPVKISAENGLQAMEVAHQIINKMSNHLGNEF